MNIFTYIHYTDDAQKIEDMVTRALPNQDGYHIEFTNDVLEFIDMERAYSPDALLIFAVSDSDSSLSMLKKVTQGAACVPIIFLYPENKLSIRFNATENGALIASPYKIDTRHEALLQHHFKNIKHMIQGVKDKVIERTISEHNLGNLKISETGQRVFWQNKHIPLTTAQYRIFEHLVVNAPRACSRQHFLDNVMSTPDRQPKSIDAHICNIRKALEAVHPGLGSIIVSERGRGFKFNMEHLNAINQSIISDALEEKVQHTTHRTEEDLILA